MFRNKLLLLVVLDLILLALVAWFVSGWRAVENKVGQEKIVVTEADLEGKIDYTLGPPAELEENFNPT